VEFATTMTGDGGRPLDDQGLAGNVADRTTPGANLPRQQTPPAALPARPPDAPPLVISNRAMLTRVATTTDEPSELRYLGPSDPHLGDGAEGAPLTDVAAPQSAAAASAWTYHPQRATANPACVYYHDLRRESLLPHPEAGCPLLWGGRW
jgi:hypothetical protein